MMYEGKIKVKKTNENGREKVVTEHYIINGVELFAEAEYKLMELCNGECEVTHLTKSSIREIVNKKEEGFPFFKASIVATFTHDDGSEKDLAYPVLVCAEDIKQANILIQEYMKQGLEDMRLKEIKETKILDVL